MRKRKLLGSVVTVVSLAVLLTFATTGTQTAAPRVAHYLLPHFAETHGSSVNAANTFDTALFATYAGGCLADIPDGDEPPSINLYFYDDRTDRPLRSAKGADVCNPCNFALGGKAGHKQTIRLENLINDAGGFPASTSPATR